MVPLAGYAPAADHYQFLNIYLLKFSCSAHRVKEYPIAIVKYGLFLVFLEINSFLVFKVLVRILLELLMGGFCI